MNGSIDCYSSANLTSNSSAFNGSCGPPPPLENPFADFTKWAFGSAIYISIVSFTTVIANSLLLLVFFIDPFKTFSNPTSYFLIGLAIGDLLTAVVQEPIFAACFMMLYLQGPLKGLELCEKSLLDVAQFQSAITMTASFLIILFFTFTQLAVVASPLKHARKVTTKRVCMCVIFLYIYSILFWVSKYWGVPEQYLYKIDVFLNSLSGAIISVVLYIVLYCMFRRKMSSSAALSGESRMQRADTKAKHNRVQRKFIVVNFLLLAILVVCSLPSALFWLAREFWYLEFTPQLLIVNLMIDNLLYLKFMLDPFVYAWRIPKYRQALATICPILKKLKLKRKSPYEASLETAMSVGQSKETVVTLDMRKFED